MKKELHIRFFNVEFYNAPKGHVKYYIEDQPEQTLTQFDRELVSWVLNIIEEKYPDAYKRACWLYADRLVNTLYYEYTIVKRFIRCNFGEQDEYYKDIDSNGNCCFEEVRCPLRGGFCEDENIICKPQVSSHLTQREMQVFRLIVGGYEATEIAEELYISILTVNRHRENIKAKIKVRTVSQMVAYWNNNKFK